MHRLIMIHPVSKASRNWDSEGGGVEYYFRDQCWFSTASRFIFSADSRYDTMAQNYRVFLIRVWVFETPRGSEFLGSEFSRHPEGLRFRDTQTVWVVRVWGFETPRGSEFLGSEVWVFEVWVFETHPTSFCAKTPFENSTWAIHPFYSMVVS